GALQEVPSNAKQAQVTAVRTVNVGVDIVLHKLNPKSDKPDVEQDTGQGQPGQVQEMTQGGAFQVEAVGFKVAKGFFNPHAPGVQAQNAVRVGQIGCQQPGGRKAPLPGQQQMGRDLVSCRQEDIAEEAPFPAPGQQSIQTQPVGFGCDIDPLLSTLAQHVIPTPVLQGQHDGHVAELAVTDQAHRHANGQQAAHVTQQGDWQARCAMPTMAAYPTPRHRNDPPPIGNAHQHQPVMGTDFGAV